MWNAKVLTWLNMASAPTATKAEPPNPKGVVLCAAPFFIYGATMIETITSFANASVKLLRSLHEKKHRQSEGLFLAEGLRILTEALEAGYAPAILAFGPAARDHALVRALIAATLDAGGKVMEVSDEILAKIARKDNPQMVLGAYALRDLSLGQLKLHKPELLIALERLKDPGNLGTILRTGDAVGASAILLVDESCDPFSTEAVRASMGALFTQKIAQASWPEFQSWIKAQNAQLVGAYLHTRTVDYQAVRYRKPTCIFMGNEQSGLPDSYAKACDTLVKMPMYGKADSLNVAMATGVLAYEVRNQFRQG
jgi:RNA methyltransferase, TrmH family